MWRISRFVLLGIRGFVLIVSTPTLVLNDYWSYLDWNISGYLSRNMQKLYSWESLAHKAAWEQSASLVTTHTPTSKYPPDSQIMSRLVCCLACWLCTQKTNCFYSKFASWNRHFWSMSLGVCIFCFIFSCYLLCDFRHNFKYWCTTVSDFKDLKTP